ncbi:MAG: hypothetical protein KatS3mg029_0782 [Saprospiraceae bacterium]|nr:MAG: hypothetical protein KatS3mg029_0782 [Saprospiraceae bacterium]
MALTDAIRERLSRLVIDTRDDDEDAMLRKVEILLQSDEPAGVRMHFQRAKVWLERLRQWQEMEPRRFHQFHSGLVGYFERLSKLRLSDAAVVTPLCPLRLTLLTLGAPVALAGWLMHAPACYGTLALCRLLNNDIHWEPTYKFVIGLLMYPLVYGLESAWLAGMLPGGGWSFLALFVLAGWWVEWYLKAGQLASAQLRMQMLPADECQALKAQRQLIRNEMQHCPALPTMQPS